MNWLKIEINLIKKKTLRESLRNFPTIEKKYWSFGEAISFDEAKKLQNATPLAKMRGFNSGPPSRFDTQNTEKIGTCLLFSAKCK